MKISHIENWITLWILIGLQTKSTTPKRLARILSAATKVTA